MLLAPLAKRAGGREQCLNRSVVGPAVRHAAAEPARVFADTRDADYQVLVRNITRMADRLRTIKRFDMSGFRPSTPYVREMKRYGILQPSFDLAKDPVDVYKTDEAYWESFWCRPSE